MSKLFTLKNLNIIFTIFITSILSANLNAEKSITAVSNTFTFDNKTGIGLYSGNVVVSDNHKELFADIIRVYRKKSGEVYKIIASGTPARFFDKSDQNDVVSGNAETITYLKFENLAILENDATLYNKDNKLKAPKIIYNTKTQVAKTIMPENNPSKGRTKIVLSNIKE